MVVTLFLLSEGALDALFFCLVVSVLVAGYGVLENGLLGVCMNLRCMTILFLLR